MFVTTLHWSFTRTPFSYSVPRKAALVFDRFLRALLERPDESGVTLSALYDKCHVEFLVSSLNDLSAQLVEFRTHHLVKTVSGTLVILKSMLNNIFLHS